MPYKPSLMVALNSDYEDAARKYMEARDESAELAEHYLYRMKIIGKNMAYTQQMIDGTLGRMPHAGMCSVTYAAHTPLAPATAPIRTGT